MNYKLKKKIYPIYNLLLELLSPILKWVYLIRKKPHSLGYLQVRWSIIKNAINDESLINQFRNRIIPEGYGIGLDERCIEYPWLFSNFKSDIKNILDAGSTFNYKQLVRHKYFSDKILNIYTFYPEFINFNEENIIYGYGDLRKMKYEDFSFDLVFCQSTLEHIDMDNSIYGYELSKNEDEKEKSYEYLKAIKECYRVLKPGGILLLTFPYGKFENHGFFQQFDSEMVDRIKDYILPIGSIEVDFIKYTSGGWVFAEKQECDNLESYNPHTGRGRGSDGAAHSRGICCVKVIKS